MRLMIFNQKLVNLNLDLNLNLIEAHQTRVARVYTIYRVTHPARVQLKGEQQHFLYHEREREHGPSSLSVP